MLPSAPSPLELASLTQSLPAIGAQAEAVSRSLEGTQGQSTALGLYVEGPEEGQALMLLQEAKPVFL